MRKRRFTTCKRRRLNHRTNTDARSWANLPGDMLGMISKRLNFIDNLSFGGVYKSWSSVSIAHKENFLASQPPLIFLIAVYAKQACSLYNIFDKQKYKTMLPNLVGRTCWGFSCGYKPDKLVYFCQAGGDDWTVYSFADKPWLIMGLAVFNGKIYVLTDCAGIGIFKLC
ncbi:unnamed protein product [Camellia sinensis]